MKNSLETWRTIVKFAENEHKTTTMLGHDRSVSATVINAWPLGRMVVHPGRSLSAPFSSSHIRRFRESDKCGVVFRSIDDFPACFCMGCCICLEPILLMHQWVRPCLKLRSAILIVLSTVVAKDANHRFQS